MPDLYYLVLQKGYLEEENTWKSSLIIIHLQNLTSIFYKEHLEKPTVAFLLLDSAPSMAKPSVLKEPKQKHGHLSKRANKRSKK